MNKIGILTSGGDCAGLNAVMRAVVFRACGTYGWHVIGIREGTLGLMRRPVDSEELTPARFTGNGLRQGGPSWKQAEQDGWKLLSPSEASKGADVVVMLAPDMAQPALYKNEIAPNLKPGVMLLFSHGFNIHYGQIAPPKDVDVTMVAPKGPGNLVRRQFEEGRGVPFLLAVHQDAPGHAFDRTLAYAHAIGGTRPGVIQTTFSEETETDLFVEQAVLCGGARALIQAGWETLVQAG